MIGGSFMAGVGRGSSVFAPASVGGQRYAGSHHNPVGSPRLGVRGAVPLHAPGGVVNRQSSVDRDSCPASLRQSLGISTPKAASSSGPLGSGGTVPSSLRGIYLQSNSGGSSAMPVGGTSGPMLLTAPIGSLNVPMGSRFISSTNAVVQMVGKDRSSDLAFQAAHTSPQLSPRPALTTASASYVPSESIAEEVVSPPPAADSDRPEVIYTGSATAAASSTAAINSRKPPVAAAASLPGLSFVSMPLVAGPTPVTTFRPVPTSLLPPSAVVGQIAQVSTSLLGSSVSHGPMSYVPPVSPWSMGYGIGSAVLPVGAGSAAAPPAWEVLATPMPSYTMAPGSLVPPITSNSFTFPGGITVGSSPAAPSSISLPQRAAPSRVARMLSAPSPALSPRAISIDPRTSSVPAAARFAPGPIVMVPTSPQTSSLPATSPLQVFRAPSPAVRLVAPPRTLPPGDRDLERDAQKILDEWEGLQCLTSDLPSNGGGNTLRPTRRGGEVGIRSSLKAHATPDVFNNIRKGLEDPRNPESNELEPDPSDHLRPRSRGRQSILAGASGSAPSRPVSPRLTDFLGSSSEAATPRHSDWHSESSVSGGAGHGPCSIGYTNQRIANKLFEASLNDNKKAGDSRQWSIQSKIEEYDPTPLDLEPEDGVKYLVRAEVDRQFAGSLRNQKPVKGSESRTPTSPGDASPRSSDLGSSRKSPRSPPRRISPGVSDSTGRRRADISDRPDPKTTTRTPIKESRSASKDSRSARERDIASVSRELERHIGGEAQHTPRAAW